MGTGLATGGWKRQHVLQKMLEWINRGPLPLFVEKAPNILPLRRDGENSIAVGIANLSGDPLHAVKFRVDAPASAKGEIGVLSEDGVIDSAKVAVTRGEGYFYVETDVTIRPMELACFRVG